MPERRHAPDAAGRRRPRPAGGSRRAIASRDALALWHDYRASGDEGLRNRLVLMYAPLVRHIACRKVGELPVSCELDDLVSAGVEALIGALDRYDPARGATLEQYLWTRVHGAIIDELRRGDWAPRSLRRWERDMRRAMSELSALHRRDPSTAELAAALSMPVAALLRRQRQLLASEVASLNTVVGIDGATAERIETIACEHDAADPFDEAARTQARERFRRAFAALGRRQREVAVLLYVMDLTLRETGLVLAVSESRVCQIHGELRSSLRRALAADAELLRAIA